VKIWKGCEKGFPMLIERKKVFKNIFRSVFVVEKFFKEIFGGERKL
jgi:hypothetical protein